MLREKVQSIDWRRARVILISGVVLLGVLARLAPIVAHRFHQDEAIYSQWALQVATGRDPWLSHFPVDKPPLFIYVLALVFTLFGPGESVARLPSELASAVSLLLVYLLARRLYGRHVAFVAVVLMAVSPFNILFAPTAFTDPLMTAMVLAALLAAAAARRGWAASGILLGLASMCKPQAVLFLPLVVVFNLLAMRADAAPVQSATRSTWPSRLRARWAAMPAGLRDALSVAAGFGVAVAPAFVWDAFRAQRPGFLEQSAISYGGLAWVPAVQWAERAGQWRALLGYVTAVPTLDAILAVGVPMLLLFGWIRRRADRRVWTDLSLALFSALFLATHTMLNFNVWDRYLLPLVPLLLLLLARALTLPFRVVAAAVTDDGCWAARLRAAYSIGLGVFLLGIVVRPMQDAAASRYPIGGDHGAYDGLTDLVAYFRGHVPGGSIVYHRWLGWHYSFYLFDFPYQLQYYSTPEELAGHAATHPGSPRYVAFPSWTSPTAAAWRLRQAGLTLRPTYETYRDDGSASFTLYRIEETTP